MTLKSNFRYLWCLVWYNYGVFLCSYNKSIEKINYTKKLINYWMLYKIPFESFDLKGIKCPYYSFLLKECKGMHKMLQLISNFLYKKPMLPFMQLHVHYLNLMRKKSHENFKVLKFWSNRLQGKWIFY